MIAALTRISTGSKTLSMSPDPKYLIIVAAAVALASCKKDEDEPAVAPPMPMAVDGFMPLAPGNYWVYERHKVDSNDVILESGGTDSTVVAGDTVLNGHLYTVLRRSLNGQPANYYASWRDSANCVVNSQNAILFCSDPLDQVIYTVYQGPVGVIIDYTVHSTPVQVALPAGDFSTYMMRASYTSIGGYPEVPEWKELRSHWADGVGRVRWYEFYGATDFGYRYDLVRYHVE
jgi:hypothetical protein